MLPSAEEHERLRYEARVGAWMWEWKDRLPDLEPVEVVSVKIEGRWRDTEIVIAQNDQGVLQHRGVAVWAPDGSPSASLHEFLRAPLDDPEHEPLGYEAQLLACLWQEKDSHGDRKQMDVTSLTIHGRRPDGLILIRWAEYTDTPRGVNFPVWQSDGTPPAPAGQHADGILLAIMEGLV